VAFPKFRNRSSRIYYQHKLGEIMAEAKMTVSTPPPTVTPDLIRGPVFNYTLMESCSSGSRIKSGMTAKTSLLRGFNLFLFIRLNDLEEFAADVVEFGVAFDFKAEDVFDIESINNMGAVGCDMR